MTSTDLRLLAVTHEASRTGAPMVLLRFLEWIHRERGTHVETLALKGGPLLEQFAAVGPVHLLEAYGTESFPRRIEQGMRRVGLADRSDEIRLRRLRWQARDLRGFDVLYCNSATSALALRILPELPPHVVSHVHELDSAFNRWMDPDDRALLLDRSSAFVVAADCVGRNLEVNHDVAAERIRRCYEFVDPPHVDPAAVARARARLGIGPDELVVGGVGTADWRKGADLFLQMVALVRRRAPELPVRFIWVGRSLEHDALHHRHDIAALGIADAMTFVGEVPDPGSYLGMMDLFCLTSREDPYPLVCLEAGALGVPVVSFANGGMVELAAAGGDEPLLDILPYLDVEAMADRVIALAADEGRRRRSAERLQQWVVDHHLSAVGAADVGMVLDDLLAVGAGRGSSNGSVGDGGGRGSGWPPP